MKPIIIVSVIGVVLLVLLAHGADSRVGVQAKRECEHMFIAGDGPKAWYSSLELERVAKGYAYDKKLDFKFEGTEMNIWIKTDGGKVLAHAHFSSNFGKPYLSIHIGRDGKVLSHRLGTLMEGPLNEK